MNWKKFFGVIVIFIVLMVCGGYLNKQCISNQVKAYVNKQEKVIERTVNFNIDEKTKIELQDSEVRRYNTNDDSYTSCLLSIIELLIGVVADLLKRDSNEHKSDNNRGNIIFKGDIIVQNFYNDQGRSEGGVKKIVNRNSENNEY